MFVFLEKDITRFHILWGYSEALKGIMIGTSSRKGSKVLSKPVEASMVPAPPFGHC